MSISKRTRILVFNRDNFQCKICGAKPPSARLEVDHIKPRSKGGLDHIDNLQTTCRNCNRGKSNLIIFSVWKKIRIIFMKILSIIKNFLISLLIMLLFYNFYNPKKFYAETIKIKTKIIKFIDGRY
jgi:hypothetical protein